MLAIVAAILWQRPGVSSASQKKLHEEGKAYAREQPHDGRSRHYEHSTRGNVIRRNVPFLMRE